MAERAGKRTRTSGVISPASKKAAAAAAAGSIEEEEAAAFQRFLEVRSKQTYAHISTQHTS